MLRYRRIGLTIKPHLTEKDAVLRRVIDILRANGAEVFIDLLSSEGASCVRGLPALEKTTSIDVLVVIGGDGTILRAVREMTDPSIPILGINRGDVGFLAEVAIEEIDSLLPSMLAGESHVEERALIAVEVVRQERKVFEGYALNEAVISQGAIARIMDLRTSVNGDVLATYHADGLIIATPTGSTAYSLAAGGPVVHPGLHALILTPINPHSLTQKPIVIPGASVVEAEIVRNNSELKEAGVSLTIDGQVYEQLRQNDIVRAHMREQSAVFLRRGSDTFYHALRTKLRWGERI